MTVMKVGEHDGYMNALSAGMLLLSRMLQGIPVDKLLSTYWRRQWPAALD